jgi:hypothetical protein
VIFVKQMLEGNHIDVPKHSERRPPRTILLSMLPVDTVSVLGLKR